MRATKEKEGRKGDHGAVNKVGKRSFEQKRANAPRECLHEKKRSRLTTS